MRKYLALVLCVFFMISASAGLAEQAKEGPMYGTKVGDICAPVELKSIDGKTTLNTGELKKPTIFMLVSSVCTACSAELKEVGMNRDKFGDFDLAAVVIDVDPSRAAGSLSKFQIPMYTDPDWKFGPVVGLSSAPSVVIVDKSGTIKYRAFGYKGGQWKDYLAAK